MKGIVAKIWGKPAPPFLLFICGFCLTSETGYVIVCLLMMYCDDRVSVIFSQSAGLCGMARLGIIYYPPPLRLYVRLIPLTVYNSLFFFHLQKIRVWRALIAHNARILKRIRTWQ